MPRLPSGQMVAISYDEVEDLSRRAEVEHNGALLLFLERESELFRLLRVVAIEWPSGIPWEELDPVETAHGLRHGISTSTGFSVADVLAGRVPWSRGDLAAFRQFLRSPRIAQEIEWVRRCLLARRASLTDRAIMWPERVTTFPH